MENRRTQFVVYDKLSLLLRYRYGGYMKKIRSGIFIIFVILLSMVGCGKESQTNSQDKSTGGNEIIQWNASHFSLKERYEMATIDNDTIYTCHYGDEGLIISVFKTDNVALTETFVIPEVTEVKSLSINSSKQICLFCSTADGDTFLMVNTNGDITSMEDIQVEDLGELPVLKKVYADSNGLYYLWYEMSVPCAEVYENGEEDIYTKLDRIYVKDQQMNTIVYEEVPDSYNNKLLSFAFDNTGIPMLFAKDEDGYYVRQIRTTDCKEYEPCRIETDELSNLESGGVITFTQDGLLYTQEGSLYLYHISNSMNEKLIDLASAGIWEEDIIYLGMSDSTIEIIDNYKSFQQSEYTVIKEGNAERKQLTIGVMTLQPEMKEMIAAFNRYQNEVTIEPIIYAEDYDYEAGYEKLTLDIIQGKAPDLISVYGIEYESLANVGAFADLYMFMQQDDEINADSFVSSVTEVYEMEGHLYTIAPTFRLYTMWGAGSVVEGRNGVNADEMIQILKDNGGDINSIYGFSADESPLTTLCSFSMDKFINWSNGTCDFIGDEFQQILSFAKEYKGNSHESLYKAIQGKDILLTLGLITSVEDYRLESELYGENIQFIGYPTESGTGVAVLFSGDELAINSKSEYQKEAWDFIRFFVQNGYNGTGFPLEKEQLDIVLNESLREITVNENGEMIASAKKSYIEKDIVSIQVYNCEPEDVEAIRTLIEMVSDKFHYNTEIQKIIEEEVGAYMQNQKELDEVCAIIQSRVQLYLNERD